MVRCWLMHLLCAASDCRAGPLQAATGIPFPVDAYCRMFDLELRFQFVLGVLKAMAKIASIRRLHLERRHSAPRRQGPYVDMAAISNAWHCCAQVFGYLRAVGVWGRA